MPYAKRRKSSSYRRRRPSKKVSRTSGSYSRRRKYSKVSRKRSPWLPGTTVSPFRKFAYNDEDFTVSLSSITTPSWRLFRGNSLYDPDYTGVGVQPYGLDQLCPIFFTSYNVRSSKITIYPVVNSANTPMFKVVVVPFRETTIPYTEFTDVMRLPHARSIRFGSLSNQTGRAPKVSSYVSTRQVLGKEEANSPNAIGYYGGNPTETWYWYIFFYNNEYATSTPDVVHFDVKITYYTKLERQVQINES